MGTLSLYFSIMEDKVCGQGEEDLEAVVAVQVLTAHWKPDFQGLVQFIYAADFLLYGIIMVVLSCSFMVQIVGIHSS